MLAARKGDATPESGVVVFPMVCLEAALIRGEPKPEFHVAHWKFLGISKFSSGFSSGFDIASLGYRDPSIKIGLPFLYTISR